MLPNKHPLFYYFIFISISFIISCKENLSTELSINTINFHNLIEKREDFSYSYISFEISLKNSSSNKKNIQFQYYDKISDTVVSKSNMWIGDNKNDTIFLCVIHNGKKDYTLNPNETHLFKIDIAMKIQSTLSLKQMHDLYYNKIIEKKLFYQINNKSQIDSITISKSISVNYLIDDKLVAFSDSVQMNKSSYSKWLNKNRKMK